MALRQIDLGTDPTGAGGDTRRLAMEKTNDNMTDIDAAFDPVTGYAAQVAAETAARIAGDNALSARLVGRNRFINGNLQVWQRRNGGRVGSGAGTLGSEAFFADRFGAAALSCTHDVQRVLYDGSQAGRSESTDGIMVCTVSGATSGSAAWIGQKIEDVRSLTGQVTISFEGNSGPTGLKVGVRVIQNFGAGGSPSADVQTSVGVITLAAGASKQSLTVNIPTVVGKAMGTTTKGYVYVVFDLCGSGYGGVISGQNGAFGFGKFQIEPGSTATAFDLRPVGYELMLCQRYYEKSYNLDVVPGTLTSEGRVGGGYAVATGGLSMFHIPFLVTKRTIPSIQMFNPFFANVSNVGQDDASQVAGTVRIAGVDGWEVQYTNTAGHWGGWIQYTADAEI